MAAAVTTVTVASAGEVSRGHDDAGSAKAGADHAVFVQGNELDGNTIRVFKRAQDGGLSSAGTYATGGKGGDQVDAPTDSLASQGSLVYDDRSGLLLAVNAGGAGSVQGFRITAKGLEPLRDAHRSLGLGNRKVPLFSSSPGQVAFTPGGRELVVTTKSANTVEVFPMTRDGRPARRAVVNDSAGAVPFAITFDKAGRMLVAEAKESMVSTYKVRVTAPSGSSRKPCPTVRTRCAGWSVPVTSSTAATPARPPRRRPSPKVSSTWR